MRRPCPTPVLTRGRGRMGGVRACRRSPEHRRCSIHTDMLVGTHLPPCLSVCLQAPQETRAACSISQNPSSISTTSPDATHYPKPEAHLVPELRTAQLFGGSTACDRGPPGRPGGQLTGKGPHSFVAAQRQTSLPQTHKKTFHPWRLRSFEI